MFSRFTHRAFRNFATVHAVHYNWGTPKAERHSRKNWNQERNLNKTFLNKKNLETNTTSEISNNFPLDLNVVNNWKLKSNRDIFLL